MDFGIILEPCGDVIDVVRHIQIVVHGAGAALNAVAGDCAPAAIGQDFGEAFSTLNADAVFAPPFFDFRLIRRTCAAFDVAADAVGVLNDADDEVRGRMIVVHLAFAGSLSHDPLDIRIIIVPAHVVNHMAHHVRHPAGGGGVDHLRTSELAAGGNFFNFLIMDPVTVLMADHGLDAGLVN